MSAEEAVEIVGLTHVGRTDVSRVGGKAASLGQRLRDGYPLPEGFVITAAVYRRFVSEGRLDCLLARVLAGEAVGRGEPVACEEASAEIRAAFEAVPVPGELERAIVDAWQGLGRGPVAVRSSATAEDLPDASFAGQQETVLGVTEAAALLQAIRRCWSSLWTSRAIAYRVRQGFSHEEVSLAVVVQRMIEPEAAGVLFTVDPVGGADEMVVNAAYGLGEAIVSGWVTPDQWRLARDDGRVVAQTLGSKERRVVACPGGVRTEAVPAEHRAQPCLPEAALLELYRLAKRIEADEGVAQDIEFAWAKGQVHLLQSRPVTTHAPRRGSLNRSQRRMLDDLLEHYPSPPVPLDEEPLQRGYEQLLAMARDVGVRFPPASDILRMDDDGVFRAFPVGPRFGVGMWRMPGALRVALRSRPERWNARLRELGGEIAALRELEVGQLRDDALLGHARRALEAGYGVARVRFAEIILPSALWGAWLTVLARLAGQRVDPFAWLGGLRFRTVDIEHGLQELADRVLAQPALRALYEGEGALPSERALAAVGEGPGFLSAVDRFLQEHGARTEVAYLPFATRSWAEDPSGVHLAVRSIVRAGQSGAAPERTRAGAQRFEDLVTGIQAGLPRFLRGHFERVLSTYRAAHVGREASLYAIEEAYGVARRAVRELGRRLVERGLLGAVDHVTFARLSELDALSAGQLDVAELRRRVGRRRARRELAVQVWRTQRPPPEVVSGEGLNGTAGSPGVARGPVRLVHSAADFGSLKLGEILVCPYTDPTWTPLFALAAAVVSNTGGALSHAAIVAREYGIPAVLGTEAATTTLRNGEEVVVDGNTGRVHRSAPRPAPGAPSVSRAS